MATAVSFRISILGNGVSESLEMTRDDELTIGLILLELTATNRLVRDPAVGALVLFRDRLVPSNRSIGDVFEDVPQSERLLIVLLVAATVRMSILNSLDVGEDSGIREAAVALPSDEDHEEELPERLPAPAVPSPSPSPVPPPIAPGAPPRPMDAPSPVPSRPSVPRSRRDDDYDDVRRSAPRARPPASMAGRAPQAETVASKRATVRYYDRMNPQKVFPFLVTLTAKKVKEIVQKQVAQAESKAFEVSLSQMIQVEPILPGCTVYPPKAEVKPDHADEQIHFWVVPQVLGEVKGAKVAIYQDGRTLTEVPLDIRVRRTKFAILMALLTLLYPAISGMVKKLGLDPASMGGFEGYFQVMNQIFNKITPEIGFGILAVFTVILWIWSRPRQRDQFWDVDVES